ncbi:hypothetical protein BGP_6123 [Beggiatoa sp. PS]|nr:hypothetical protein BGP_6123 [Beggiatoa sp. PS]
MKYGSAGLRTLDAIQLASALTLKGQPKVHFLLRLNSWNLFSSKKV